MKKTLAIYIIFIISSIITENSSATPKWLESEVLEVCKVTQDVRINQKWEDNNGTWIKGNPIFLKEGDLLTVHKSKSKTIKKWFSSSNGSFPFRNTHFHIVTLDKDYGEKKVGKKKVKDVIKDCKKPENKTTSATKKTTEFGYKVKKDFSKFEGESIMFVTISCGKSKRGDHAWHSTFEGIVTKNTFQGSRNWKSSKYKGDTGYEFYNGFKNDKTFILIANGKYEKSSDKWSYKFVSKEDLTVYEHLLNGLETIRGKDKSRRKCQIKTVKDIIIPIRHAMRAYYREDISNDLIDKNKNLEKEYNKVKSENTSLNKKNEDLIDKISELEERIFLTENQKKEEEKLADEKVAEQKRIEEEKRIAEENKISEENKKAEEKKKSEEKRKALEDRKLSLFFEETDLKKAKKYLNNVEEFVKANPNTFDILIIAEYLNKLRTVYEGNLTEEAYNTMESLMEHTNKNSTFVDFIKKINKNEKIEKIQKVDGEIRKIENYVSNFEIYLSKNIKSMHASRIIDRIKKSQNIIDKATKFSQLEKANSSNKKLEDFLKNIQKEIYSAESNIIKFKDYLKKNIGSELTASILIELEQLDKAILSEDPLLLTTTNDRANKFILEHIEKP